MDETIVHILIGVIWVFGPLLWRLLTGKSKKKAMGDVSETANVHEEIPSSSGDRGDVTSPPSVPASVGVSTSVRQAQVPASGTTDACDRIMTMLTLLRQRVLVLVNVCDVRKLHMLRDEIRMRLYEPVGELLQGCQKEALGDIVDAGRLNGYRSAIDVAETQLSFFERLVEKRPRGAETELNMVDAQLRAYWTPLQRHFALYGVGFQSIVPIATSRQFRGGGDLVFIEMDDDAALGSQHWRGLPLYLVTAWIDGVPGFSRRLTSELSLPDARDAMMGFQTTGRLSMDGLTAALVSSVFADVLATLMSGPNHARLLLEASRIASDSSVNRFVVAQGERLFELPLVIRIIAVSRVLEHLGQWPEFEEKAMHIVGDSDKMMLSASPLPDVPVPIADLKPDLCRRVDQLLTDGLSVFGNVPLLDIPHLAYDADTAQAVARLIPQLKGGYLAPPFDFKEVSLALGEVLQGPLGSRAMQAAHRALMANEQPRRSSVRSDRHHSLKEVFTSPGGVVGAMMIQSLAPHKPPARYGG